MSFTDITYCDVVVGGSIYDHRKLITCTESFVKFGHVIFEIYEQTNIYGQRERERETRTLTAVLCALRRPKYFSNLLPEN